MKALARMTANLSRSGAARNEAAGASTPPTSLCADGTGAPSHVPHPHRPPHRAGGNIRPPRRSPPPPSPPPAYTSSFGAFPAPAAPRPSPSTPQTATSTPSPRPVATASAAIDASGSPKNFAAAPPGTNFLTGLGTDVDPGGATTGVAIDRSGGPADGDIYLTTFAGIKVYDNDGHLLTTLDGSGTPVGSYNESCGVAVDQSNGNVYVGDYSGNVWRYSPSGATPTEGDYSGGITTPFNPCQVAADSGHVYAADYDNGGPVKRFSASDFTMALTPPSLTGTTVDATATALATDSATGNLYVDEGNKVSVFASTGASIYSFGSLL